MLSAKALVAYTLACGMATVAIITNWRATQVPWLGNDYGQTLGLWKFVSRGISVEFPDQQICYKHPNFCASWRTATFLFTLALLPEVLVLLALLFSWVCHRRKKTVWVAKYLLAFAVLSLLMGIIFWVGAKANLDNILATESWKLIGGWHLIVLSMLCSLFLFGLMFWFREIVKDDYIRLPERRGRRSSSDLDSDGSYSDSSENNEDSDDDISVPEDIPAEQIDFYIFNKRARRQELARRLR